MEEKKANDKGEGHVEGKEAMNPTGGQPTGNPTGGQPMQPMGGQPMTPPMAHPGFAYPGYFGGPPMAYGQPSGNAPGYADPAGHHDSPGMHPHSVPAPVIHYPKYEEYKYGPAGPLAGPTERHAPAPAGITDSVRRFLGLDDGQLWKGILIGAGIAMLLTNKTVQKTIMKAGMKAYRAAETGVEEIKEKAADIKAELEQKK